MFSNLFQHCLNSCGGLKRGRSHLSGMAAAVLNLMPEEDPLNVSAFMSAITELLLSVLLLMGAAIAFITSQFAKYFELEPPCSYIGCEHPGHSEIARNKRYQVSSSCENEFSLNDLCPGCVLSRSRPNYLHENVALTEDRQDEDVSHNLDNKDCISRDNNAADVPGCQHSELTGREGCARENATNVHPNSCLMCAHCNRPPSTSVEPHNFMKKQLDNRQDTHCWPNVNIADDGSVDAVGSSADGNCCDLDDSETSSTSVASMKDLCLSKKKRLWTEFGSVFEEMPRNIREHKVRDSEGEFRSRLQDEVFNSGVKGVDTQSRPSCGVANESLQAAASRGNCEGFEGAEISASSPDQFVHAGDAACEIMKSFNEANVVRRSSQTESIDKSGDVIAENMNAALHKQDEIKRIEAGSEYLQKCCTPKHAFKRHETVDVGNKNLICLKNGQGIRKQQQNSEIIKCRELAVSECVGRSGNSLFNAEGFEDIASKASKEKTITTVESSDASQFIDGIEGESLEASHQVSDLIKPLNKALHQGSDLQDNSGKHVESSVAEKVSQQTGVNVFAGGSHQYKFLDPVGEFARCPCKDVGFWEMDSGNVPAVAQEEGTSEAIGIGHLHDSQQGFDEKKRTIREQQEVPKGPSLTLKLAHGHQVTGLGRDIPCNVQIAKELNESTEDIGHDASKNIQSNSIKTFNIGETAQKLQQNLELAQERPPQGNPCKYEDEKDSFSQSDHGKDLDSLKKTLQVERSALAALEVELEKERSAAAIAASEAMAMISRLQEEKSAMQMEAAQFQRMSEEKAEYDQQAMSLLKEILFKCEKEKFALEREIELYRTKHMAEKVNTINMNGMVRDNSDLPTQGIKSIRLPNVCEDGDSASSPAEQVSVKCEALNPGIGLETVNDLDMVELKCKKRQRITPSNSCDAKEDSTLALSITEELIDKAVGFESPCLETLFKSNHTSLFNTQEVQHIQKGCEDLLEMERSVFATDDEETQFILERLWVLEEELHELRDQGLREEELHQDCTDAGETIVNLIDKSCAGSEYANKPSVDSCPKTAFQLGPDWPEFCVNSNCLPALSESSKDSTNPCYVQHGHGMVSGLQEKERRTRDGFATAELLPAHSRNEAHPVSQQYRHHPVNVQGRKYAEVFRDQQQKPDLSSVDMSQDAVSSAVEGKELHLGRVHIAKRLFFPNDAIVQSSAFVRDSLYNENFWEEGQPNFHIKIKSRIGDETQTATEADIQQLTMRLKVLEADRELLKETLEMFQVKDTGLDLLQEIVQHLRELRNTDIQRANAVNLPQEVDPHWTTSKVPAVKKRRH